MIDAIRNLDADVTSIEAARSRMEVVDDISTSGFDHGIGPGVYDIHSPRVPSAAEVQALLERAVAEIPASKLWVNPDCGLKTRGYDETVASLEHIIEATRAVRAELARARCSPSTSNTARADVAGSRHPPGCSAIHGGLPCTAGCGAQADRRTVGACDSRCTNPAAARRPPSSSTASCRIRAPGIG